MAGTIVARLAEFASALDGRRLPEAVVEKAKVCILDTLGMAVGGSGLEAAEVALRAARALGAPGEARVWATGERLRAVDGVMPNSVMAHCFLQDDWDSVSHAHIGVAVVPTVFTMAEELGRSGGDALAATVAGYEVESRAGVLSVPAFTRGFRASSVYACFGAASAAARLMGLAAEPFKNALGCAGSVTGGVLQPWVDGSMEWAFQEGFACRAGILAATLAREGLRGCDNVLEGPRGVNVSFSGSREGEESALAGLGERFNILDTCFKRFATGGANQGSAAVAFDLRRRHGIDHRRIKAVRVDIPDTGTHERMNYAGIAYQGPFRTVDQCLISKPFAIATILKTGALDIGTVRREQADPGIAALAHKVALREVRGISGWSLRMEIELDDGTVIRGDGANIDKSHIYLNRDLAAEKFLAMTGDRLGAERARRAVDLVFGLDRLDGVSSLLDCLVVGGRGGQRD